MQPTLPVGDALTRLNAVRTRMAPVHADGASALIDVNQPEILAVIRQTLHDVGLKHEAAAAVARVKPSQFSAALNGQGNFGASWLWAQDDVFFARFLANVQAARQLTPERTSAVRRQRIVELIDLLLTECA